MEVETVHDVEDGIWDNLESSYHRLLNLLSVLERRANLIRVFILTIIINPKKASVAVPN